MPNELKPCKCGAYPFVCTTYFLSLRFPLFHTAECLYCHKKVTRLTEKSVIKAWNRRADNG